MASHGGTANDRKAAWRPGYAIVFTGVAVAAIWGSVLLAGVVAADIATGSGQTFLPLVGRLAWAWGLTATVFVVLVGVAGVRAGAPSATPWIALALGSAFVWTMVFLISVLGPVFLILGAALLGLLVLRALVTLTGRQVWR
jgi:hypothetical protein